MCALVRQLDLHAASLWLRDVGVLRLSRDGQRIELSWLDKAHADDEAAPAACSELFPVNYAGERIGELRWGAGGTESSIRPDDGACLTECGAAFARRCALLYMRYEAQRWAQQRLGHGLLLVGMSEPLHQMEIFVERASRSTLPVLLNGEFGTEKVPLAVALHCCGPRRDEPFVEVNCTDPVGEPSQWFKQAAGGTLFFNGIDELAPPLQSQLPQHLHSRLGQWLVVPDACEARVVASTTFDLRQRVEEGRFSRALLAELDFLSATIPPLRTRKDDVAPLVVAALEHQGYVAERKCSDVLREICEAYVWPENVFELERVIARLAVMTDSDAITREDVEHYAPWLAGQAERAHEAEVSGVGGRDTATATAVAQRNVTEANEFELQVSAAPAHWARCVMTRNASELGRLHKALRKALLYLGEHYASPVSMDQLAQHAHVSPSHLSYLFRHTLNVAFKPLLQYIRIEKAKEMLMRDYGARITEVALSVGFGDLSHFEKSFRRIVGVSPRKFRHAGL